MQRRSPVFLALGMVWGIAPASAPAQSPAEADNDITILNEITVSSTRTSRRNDNIPDTVTVTHARNNEEKGARDIKEMFSDEIDVTVPRQQARFTAAGQTAFGRAGNESINIRGLEGNRVLMMVDGIRVPNSFSFGPFATGRGDYLEIDGFGKTEVLRGPASTQYGSDGLGGAVSFRTFAPEDWLREGKPRTGFVRSGYAQVDRSWNNTLGAAARAGRWQGLVLASARQGHEPGNQGGNTALNSTRTAPDPQNDRGRYLLGKAVVALNANQQLEFGAERQRRKLDTEVYSARAIPPLVAGSTTNLTARDQIMRDRLSLEHRFDDLNAPWLQRARSRFYWQGAEVRQYADEDRLNAAERIRDNRYRQNEIGASTQLESNLAGNPAQRLSYGADWSQSRFSAVSNGTVPSPGSTFPGKPFPDTLYTRGGLFMQDEIEAGSFSIIPGLRFDQYALSASGKGYQGTAVSLSGQALTPRLGLVWRLDPRIMPYAQWARGYKAPTPDQVNNFHASPGTARYVYRSLGNPGLRAEHADSHEIGLRGKISALRYALTAYDNRYRDFIDSQIVSGNGTPGNPAIIQYVNMEQARIRGFELRSEWQWGAHWSSTAGIAWSRGDSTRNGVSAPLDSVMPLRAVLGLRFDNGRWGARADLTHSEGKARDRIKPAGSRLPVQFAPPAHTVLDLGAHWKTARHVTVNASLDNVFDRKYWRWSDVRGVDERSTYKDAFTAPGRNARLSIRYDF